jgi:hypothetical protein
MTFKQPAIINETPNIFLRAKIPVRSGPRLWVVVLTTFTAPIIAVRLSDGKAAARNAERGATSILCEQALSTRNVKANGRLFGTEISDKQMADGRCVKTIVYYIG